MCHIDDAHDAEDEREAERRQRQHGGGHGAFENGEQQMGAEGQGCCYRKTESGNATTPA
jgi:hypothetical protein